MLDLPVEKILGVKNARVKQFNKMGIETIEDVIKNYPRYYEDRSAIASIFEAVTDEKVLIKGQVVSKPTYRSIRKNLNMIKFQICDESGKAEVIYFNQKYMMDLIKEGETYLFFGKIKREFSKTQLVNPLTEQEENHTGRIMPVYSLTKDLSQKVYSNILKNVISNLDNQLEETLPSYIKEKLELCDILFAYNNIHFPISFYALELAKKRLIFEELLFMQLGLIKLKKINSDSQGVKITDFSIVTKLCERLPFDLTTAQKRVVNEICKDMLHGRKLNRLVQGDVGSGKTMVALCSMLVAVNASYQCAMVAPTEILATQHYDGLKSYFDEFGFSIALLTGSTTKKQKESILKGLANGEIQVVIGTHAIFYDDVKFKNFGLAVTDEQHRFGVMQRNALYKKGNNPHVLVMTATPIPRTLALILYSDLDLSIIDELPPGRQEIETLVLNEKNREKADFIIEKELSNNSQIYVVCPLVEESEHIELDLKNVIEYNEILKRKYGKYNVALLHGKMKPKEKDAIMLSFKNKEIDILVSTTVIEVGVNVPNATVMLIENAERFGLSALHQLRGRVGRGTKKSYAILMSDLKTKATQERLGIMSKTNDGFKISEKDLELRGPGDFFGNEQSGFLDLKIADLLKDVRLLNLAVNVAKEILKDDFKLEKTKNELLRKNVDKLFKQKGIEIFN